MVWLASFVFSRKVGRALKCEALDVLGCCDDAAAGSCT